MAVVQVIFDRLPAVAAELEPHLSALLSQAAQDVALGAQTLIQQSPGGGRVYHGHQASAPGDPPASDSGELMGSIHATGAGLSAEVHVDSPHGIYLEFGTSKMAPRPFLAPAALQERPKLDGMLADLVVLL